MKRIKTLLTDIKMDLVAIFVLLAAGALLLRSCFDPAHSFGVFMDNEFLTGTILSSMSQTLESGEWPLRVPAILGGFPIYNLTQFSSFYPFYFAALPWFGTPLEAAETLHWVSLGHLLIFCVNAYIFLRVAGRSKLASMGGAAFIAFGANSLVYVTWVQIIAPYSWLPLYLAGIVGILEGRRSLVYPLSSICSLVLMAFASPAQPLIHAILFTAVLTIFSFAYGLANGDRLQMAPVGRLIWVGIISILISAPATLPAALEFKEMLRWLGSDFPPVRGHERIPFEASQTDQLSFVDLGGVLMRQASNSVGSQFAGPVAMVLAILGISSGRKSWVAMATATLGIYAAVSALGDNSPLGLVNYYLPLLNKIREPSRFLVIFQLATGVLGAFGIDAVRRIVESTSDRTVSRTLWITGAISYCFTLALIIQFGGTLTSFHDGMWSIAILAGLLIISYILLQYATPRSAGNLAAFCWVAGLFSVMAINVDWTPPTKSSSTFLNKNGIALDIAIAKVAERDPDHNYRLIFGGDIDKQIAAMLASYRGVRSLNAYVNPAPAVQFEELYNHAPRKDNYLQILGGRYLLCKDCAQEDYPAYSIIDEIAGYQILETDAALPYVQLLDRVDGTYSNLDDFLAKTTHKDLKDGILFLPKDEQIALNIGHPGECVQEDSIRKSNEISFLVSCNSAAFLVLNEYFSRAWSVRIDGALSRTIVVNGNQIGVALTPGGHVVEFTYEPRLFYQSLKLSLIGLALLGLWLFWTLRFSRRLRKN